MNEMTLPPRREMVDAFLSRDASYEGLFITAVRTTGIFCRPTCSARKPKPENVEFFPSCRDALLAGYRPCRRCRPLEEIGTDPAWAKSLIAEIEHEPTRRWRDEDLRRLDLDPARVRRWFKRRHGMTFHAYSRARRLGEAVSRLQDGETVTEVAFDHGYESLSGFGDAFRKFAGTHPTARRDATLVQVTRLATPLGPMIAGATEEHVVLLEFADRRMLPTQFARLEKRLGAVFAPSTNGLLRRLDEQLRAYFAGRLVRFDLPLAYPGTEFQRTVWRRLLEIPIGTTASYAEIARAIGRPKAVRAVARANGENRLGILIPCHRVIGSDGRLTGYGGGLWRKRRLLELENAFPDSNAEPE